MDSEIGQCIVTPVLGKPISEALESSKATKKEYLADEKGLKDSVEQLDELELAEYKLGEPMCLTNLFVKRPCCVILTGFALMFVLSVVCFYFDFQVITPLHDRDYLVWGDKYTNNYDKSVLAKRELQVFGDTEYPLQSQVQQDWSVVFVYQSTNDINTGSSIWSKDVLISIRDFENDIKQDSDYKLICLAKT